MKQGGGGGCLCIGIGSPMRALSRACDSACDIYVRGMSGYASHVPVGAVAGGRGPGFFGGTATAMYTRASSDRADDLVSAAPKQRRVAPKPADVGVAATKVHVSQEPAAAAGQLRRKGAAMETIAEDAPCEFGACALRRP